MSKSALIAIAAAIILFAAAGYMLFGRTDPSAVVPGDAAATAAEIEFLSLTERINPVSFDIKITKDPRFMVLQDIGTAIVEETKGRTDPFGPLGR